MAGRRGDGTIYLRGDGRWSGQIRHPEGGRYTVYGRTREEASERLAAAREALAPRGPRPGETVPSLDELRRHRAAIRRVARAERATSIRVFGSVARGDAGAYSDYDLVVDLDPKLHGFEAFDRLDRLERRLTRLLGRQVHVVTARHESAFTRRVLRDAVGF